MNREQLEERITKAFSDFQNGKSREGVIVLLANDMETALSSQLGKVPTPTKDEISYKAVVWVGNNVPRIGVGHREAFIAGFNEALSSPSSTVLPEKELSEITDEDIDRLFLENCRGGSIDISRSETENILTLQDFKDCIKQLKHK